MILYYYNENSMGRGAWLAAIHGSPKSQTWATERVCTCTHTQWEILRVKTSTKISKFIYYLKFEFDWQISVTVQIGLKR